jgi:outer membrane putative beta-barrel porin/alpha-amylase
VLRLVTAIVFVWTYLVPCAAQELEPRAYSPSPVGVSFVVVGGGRSQGGVLLDPSIAVDDLSATIQSVTIGLGRTFAVAHRQALIVAAIPVARMDASGRIGANREAVARTGVADPRVKLSIGLAGAPALAPAEFARAPRRTAVGVSINVVPPLGTYESGRLINLGANRWSFKPEIGISHPVRRWTIEGSAGAWMFGANDAFFPGSGRRTQALMTAFQGHAVYEIWRHGWIALDGTWYAGGESTLNGMSNHDRESNTRVGATFSIPLWARQSVKLSYSTGATTRVGTDFEAFTASWQLTMF